tara:strand:- start:2130 stop:2357 length:228 start_codon:yes stop_codon:yes gene_type:complete
MNKIDKIISIIRNLKEEGMSVGAPTNNTGSTPGEPGYSSSGDQEHAGYDKLMPKRKRKRKCKPPTILLRREPPVF